MRWFMILRPTIQLHHSRSGQEWLRTKGLRGDHVSGSNPGDAETCPPVMELIDHIEEFVGEHLQTKTGPGNDLVVDPQRSVPTPASMKNCLVDRHLLFLENWCKPKGEWLNLKQTLFLCDHNSWNRAERSQDKYLVNWWCQKLCAKGLPYQEKRISYTCSCFTINWADQEGTYNLGVHIIRDGWNQPHAYWDFKFRS